MHALWISLKEKGSCRSKQIDVMTQPKKSSKKTDQELANKLVSQRRNSFGEVTIRRNQSRRRCNLGWDRRHHTRTQFFELSNGDPARNVIEMIYRRASTNPEKPLREIKRVLRVKNSVEILEMFEKYREIVKLNAYEQHKRHPRSVVDGNEVLRFYGTTMSCCSEKRRRVSELCKDPWCRVCRTIQPNFDTEHTKKNGILLSTNSEDFSNNNGAAFSEGTKMKRAVIVCRVIAGMYEGHECNSESLLVWNPCAVLPCFVIVFT